MKTTAPSPEVMQAVAGSGKTHWLVDRYVELVVGQGLSPVNVPIITFTDAAGRELVDRVRSVLAGIASGKRAERPATGDEVKAAGQALADLGASPIGTIHSFARRLLLQQAVDAGVPFGVEVRETFDITLENQMRTRIKANIRSLQFTQPIPDWAVTREGSNKRPTYLDQDAGQLLSGVSSAMLQAPDQVNISPADGYGRLEVAWADLAAVSGPGGGVLSVGDLLVLVRDIRLGFTELAAGSTKNAADFGKRIEKIDELVAGLAGVDEQEAGPAKLWKGSLTWATAPMRKRLETGGRHDLLDLIDQVTAHCAAAKARRALSCRSYAAVAGALALEAHLFARQSEGTDWLFQDELLLRALQLIRNQEPARKSLQARYRVILLDEAQDIDATQTAMLLELTEAAGLIVVGDPQQSIYGFRGADYTTFERLKGELHANEKTENLTQTRRCLPVVVDVVNALFAGDSHHTKMTTYREREAMSGSVTVLIGQADKDQDGNRLKVTADDYRLAQADAIADEVVAFLQPDAPRSRWVKVKGAPGEKHQLVRAKPADIAILVPSRTPVPSIEAALLARGVLVSVRTSRDMARHPVAEGMAAALLAIASLQDTRSLLVALRSPVFACTDADLSRHVIVTGHSLSLRSHIRGRIAQREFDTAPPATTVEACLDVLSAAHRLFRAQGPGPALDLIESQRAVLATLAAADGADWLTGWKQLRQLRDTVADRHRTTPEPAHRFAQWLIEQLAAAAGTNGTVLDEPDSESVTITTMHQGKGLQWPIVVTAALNAKDNRKSKLLFDGDRLAVHITNDYSTLTNANSLPADASPEITRLMYVALTRAQDHLVISGMGPDDENSPSPIRPTCIAAAVETVGGAWATQVDVPVHPKQEPEATPVRLNHDRGVPTRSGDVDSRLAKVAKSSAFVLRRSRPSSAEHGEQVGVVPSWSVTDAGLPGSAAATGTLVHEVLATVGLQGFTDTTLSLETSMGEAWGQAKNLASLDGVDESRALQLLKSARTSQVLKRAAHAKYLRRELPICGSHNAGKELVVMQGSIDLLFAEADDNGPNLRWVLVDYKTDSGQLTEDQFKALYDQQLAAYEELLNAAEVPVSEKWLIRITDTATTDVSLELTSNA